MFRHYLLRDKVVLITGASRGLGLVLARELASAGARIVLASRDAWELQRAHDELASRGADLLAFPCDVADEGQVDELARAAVDWFGRIDVLVNNAGVIHVGPWAAMRDEDFSRAFATHFWGPLWLMRAVVPAMRRQGGGSIVNISSIGGVVGLPHLAPYCASKFALSGLGESLRAELAGDGIQVMDVCAWSALATLPIFSTSAPRAARRIVKALRRGEKRIVVGISARLLVWVRAIAPGLLRRALELAERTAFPARGTSAPAEAKLGERAASKRLLSTLGGRSARRHDDLRAAYR
jgi:NAD(P)-dependent dehydrogenase (short-subunit alcohol dehydrogenase family)